MSDADNKGLQAHNEYLAKLAADNTSQQDKYTSNFTEHATGEREEYYPGTLNKNKYGETLIKNLASEDEHKASIKNQAIVHGGVHPTDMKLKYNNPYIGADDFAAGDSPDGPHGVPLINYRLMSKLNDHLNDPDFNPILAEPEIPITPKSIMPDLAAFSKVGDPRWSLGAALQKMFQTQLPKINAWQEMVEAGGQIIKDTYICMADGTIIKKASAETLNYLNNLNGASQVDVTTTSDGTGESTVNIKSTPFSLSGSSFTIPPPSAEKMVEDFHRERNAALKRHADAFVAYIKNHYMTPIWIPSIEEFKTWDVEAVMLNPPGMFFLRLKWYVWYKEFVREKFIPKHWEIRDPNNPNKWVYYADWYNENDTVNGIGHFVTEDPSAPNGAPDPETVGTAGEYYNGTFFTNTALNQFGKQALLDAKTQIRLIPSYWEGYWDIFNNEQGGPGPASWRNSKGKDGGPRFRPGKYNGWRHVSESRGPTNGELTNIRAKRYYQDQMDYVVAELAVPRKDVGNIIATNNHREAMRDLSEPIPDYTTMT